MRQNRSWLPYLLILLAIVLLALQEIGLLRPMESVLSYVVAPVERVFSGVVGSMGSLSQSFGEVQELRTQVTELKKQNDALLVENIRLREFVAETQQLREQLNFASTNPTFSLVGADVVERGCDRFPCGTVLGEDTNPYLRYIVINAGSRSGVAIGMPVVTGGAILVGRVARVTPNQAFVQLIDDPSSNVAAMLQDSRVTGLVIGQDDGSISMVDILPDEKVNEGEIVVTSGLGSLLPKGLVLGQVATVKYQESALFQEAILRPAMDFRRLETVLVITDFERTSSPAAGEETNP
jgi:rod shape-determining protein MreC